MQLDRFINQRIRYSLHNEAGTREGVCTGLDATGRELRIEGALVPWQSIANCAILPEAGPAVPVPVEPVPPPAPAAPVSETPRERLRREHSNRGPLIHKAEDVPPENVYQPKSERA